jgi:hypothetical protein
VIVEWPPNTGFRGAAIAADFAELQSPQLLPNCNRRSFCRTAIAAAFTELLSPQLLR